jgi:arylsulfatase A-like enzyme
LLFPAPRAINELTSHVDLLPTLLSFADGDVDEAAAILRRDHDQVGTPVGRDLTGLILGLEPETAGDQAVYFMTDDDVSHGETQENPLGFDYTSVAQPNRVETVIASLPGSVGRDRWKFSRYFDPNGVEPDEFELYNLGLDPYEERNLAHPRHATPFAQQARARLSELLTQQRSQKRLQQHVAARVNG